MTAKKRFFCLILMAIVLFCSACDTKSILQTSADTMSAAFEESRDLFENVVKELAAFDELYVYQEYEDVVGSNGHIEVYNGLFFESTGCVDEDKIALLYDTAYPLFLQYNLHSILGFCGFDGTVRFIFEEELGQTAFLEYSANDSFPKATMTILDSKHLDVGWFALVHSD